VPGLPRLLERPLQVGRGAARRGRRTIARLTGHRAAAVEPWAQSVGSPWDDIPPTTEVTCNICRWAGDGFGGGAHSEAAVCPQCGSIARDRFLFFCLQARADPPADGARLRLLETSPRLGPGYRQAMARWFDYTCSDFDERAHAGTVRLDLQAIDLPDSSLDVILSPHVLEHVPDSDRALGELARVLAPGGRLELQVPLLQARTAPPSSPEFHGDRTPVHWRFGFDLTDRLRAHGLVTSLLTTAPFLDAVGGGVSWTGTTSPEFDVDGLLAGAPVDLVAVADAADAERFGFEPAYMFFTWDCVKPR
jgi:SAM-dependent methyltransferase